MKDPIKSISASAPEALEVIPYTEEEYKINYDQCTPGIFEGQKYYEIPVKGSYTLQYLGREILVSLEKGMKVVFDEDTINIFEGRKHLLFIEKGVIQL